MARPAASSTGSAHGRPTSWTLIGKPVLVPRGEGQRGHADQARGHQEREGIAPPISPCGGAGPAVAGATTRSMSAVASR